MSKISIRKDCIAVAAYTSANVCFFNDNKKVSLKLPCETREGRLNGKAASSNQTDTDQRNTILGLQFSPCGKWLCAFSSKKQLILWSTNDWSNIERYLPKVACSLAFTPDSKNIVIVDKSGDAFLYSTENFTGETHMLLGHLSMLLDVLITPNGKFIITCDRDEKIRVSQFPNAYNITSFCLGHTQFVSSLCIVPHNSSVLLSASGDGTIRFWNYEKGLCLSSHVCSEDAVPRVKCSASEKDDTSELKSVPIAKIRCGLIDSNISVLSVVVFGTHGCLIYTVNDLNIKYVETVCEDEEIIDLAFGGTGELWIYSVTKEEPIRLFCFDRDSWKLCPSTKYESIVKEMCEFLQSIPIESGNSIIPQLFKRRFENIKDYYDQKKARLGH